MVLLCFLLGIVFGSFYNVVIYRVPNDISVAKGRSFCPNCKTQLNALDLVPVFSQLFLKNKCRYCKQKISLRYPMIELATGLLFALAYLVFGLSRELVMILPFWSMLLITAVIDLDEMSIYDGILWIGTAPAAVYLIWEGIETASWGHLLEHGIGFALGFGSFLLIYWIVKLIYKEEKFGFGDVMLMGSIGLCLKWRGTIIAFLLSFFLAVLGVAIQRLLGKGMKRDTELPFGPYMCIAALLTSIFGERIWAWYMSMFLL